jgi:N-succinyldiaminopimelate aminotransferase
MVTPGSWIRAARGAMLLVDGAPGTTIFAEMSALAAATGAINLGQGFPDEDGPAEVLAAAKAAIDSGLNQYPPGRGMPVLREAIADHQRRFYGIEVDPDREVLVTAGATEAIAATILALTEPGDEVVTLEPFYDEYGAMIELAGARHVTVPVRWPDFQPDPDDLRAAISDRTRIIVLNTPHNPTGSVLPRETLELIVDLAERHDAILMTDEVYEHLVFDAPHVAPASLPGAWHRTVSISSGGKTFSTTGWKVGWITAPPALLEAILAVKQFLTFVNAAPFQPAIAAGLALPDEFFTATTRTLRAKRDLLASGLRSAGFTVSTPSAGYFVIADAAALGHTDAVEFCRSLPALAGVVGVPVTALVSEPHRGDYASLVRFAFCKRTEVLDDAVSRLSALQR